MKQLLRFLLITVCATSVFALNVEDEIENLKQMDRVAESKKAINKAKAEIQSAQHQLTYREEQERRDKILFDKEAKSEHEYRESILETAEARFELHNRKVALVWLETTNEISRLKASWAAGEAKDIKALRKQYDLRTNNRCSEARNTYNLDNSRMEFASYHYNTMKKLFEKEAVTEMDYLEANKFLQQANVGVKKSAKQVSEFCAGIEG